MRSIGNIPVDRTRSQNEGRPQQRNNVERRKRPRINIVGEDDRFSTLDEKFSSLDKQSKFGGFPQNNREFFIPQNGQNNGIPFAKRPNFDSATEISNKKPLSTEDLYSQEANAKPLEADPYQL